MCLCSNYETKIRYGNKTLHTHTGLEALSSRQLPVLIKTGWNMSCYAQFLSRCLHKYKAVLIIKTTWWFWASFSSLPKRWLHNSLQQTKQGQKNKFLCKNNHFEPMFINTIIWFTYAKTPSKFENWQTSRLS